MGKKRNQRRRHRPRFRRRTHEPTLPDVVQPPVESPPPVVRVISYGPTQVEEFEGPELDKVPRLLEQHPVTWIDINGIGDGHLLQELRAMFGFHPLAMEDVVNAHQHAKIEPYDSHLFLVVRAVSMLEHPSTEQIAMFLGRNFLVTIQEKGGDRFAHLRRWITDSRGEIRQRGTDYLAYATIDSTIDTYFPVVDQYADRIDEIEASVANASGSETIEQIQEVGHGLLLVRRAIRPHRDMLTQLLRDRHTVIAENTRIYLRDCYDHTMQILEFVEVYRETTWSLRDYYLSVLSTRMNEVMKVLTLIATVFMPLSFIAAVYGMNFDTNSPYNMPELKWRFGYPFAWGVMLATAAVMVVFFRKRGWLGGKA